MTRLLILPILCLTMAGCGDKPRIEFAKPPADRLVCPDEPAVPAEPVTDEDNATYLKGMRNAWAGCKADVDWLRSWFRELK